MLTIEKFIKSISDVNTKNLEFVVGGDRGEKYLKTSLLELNEKYNILEKYDIFIIRKDIKEVHKLTP